MQIVTIGELKSQFSDFLGKVRKGQEIVISYGKKKEKVALLIPYRHRASKGSRKLGILKGKTKCIITPGFSFTDEEFLSS